MTAKETVREFFTYGYERLDEERLMHLIGDVYIDHSPCQARSNRECIGVLKGTASFFSDITCDIADMIEEDGKVCARIIFTATHSGTAWGIPATGRRISFEALEVFRVEDGIITESWGYWPEPDIRAKLA